MGRSGPTIYHYYIIVKVDLLIKPTCKDHVLTYIICIYREEMGSRRKVKSRSDEEECITWTS